MKINPTKCVIVSDVGGHRGRVVEIVEIRPYKECQSGIMCKVFLPSNSKRPRPTWLDYGHFVALRENNVAETPKEEECDGASEG